jgi:formate hydrogenlyase transcriptional activator
MIAAAARAARIESSVSIESRAVAGPPAQSETSTLQQYQALLDVSRSILAHSDLNELFRDLSQLLRRVLRFDFLNLVLHEAERNAMRLHILEADAPHEPAPWDWLPVPDSPAGWVWETQETLVIADTSAEQRWPLVLEILRKNDIQTVCYLPLTSAHRRLGAIGFGFRARDAVTSADIAFMSNVAAPVAVAVDNALNHDALSRERDRLRVLLEINNALVSSLDEQELFKAIASCLAQVMPHDYASLALISPDGRRLVIRALDFPGGSGLVRHEMDIAAEASLAAGPLREREPRRFDETMLKEANSDIARRLAAEGIATVVCLPLVTRNRALGTLNIGSRRSTAFPPADVAFLAQVSAQIAIAVENALAFREISQLKDRLAEEKLYLEDEIRTDRNFTEMVGESAAFRRVLKQAETVAPTDATVLILGETGTGKELVARAIHQLSARRDRTFVKLNCAAIPTGLLESELFGHEKGAFTGAIAQKIGRLELADGGTMFLDEIGDIPLELQPKLLRALQEHEFERLGGVRTIRVDVRVIAATNRDLPKMVAEREFRSDLYYRLSVFPIQMPALRERRADIPILVRYFAQKYARRLNRRIESIPAETMERLQRYDWPGNIRELENLIERAVIVSPGPALYVPELDLQAETAAEPIRTLAAAEREHIMRALMETNWVLGGPNGAAARLGLKRTTLQSRMKKLGISKRR